MSEGGGQSVVFTLSGLPNFKLYHYTAAGGSTTLKNIYSDEDLQTTMAQPAVADANGVIQFWGHGDYRFLIHSSADVEQYDWDVFHVSQGQSVILNYDTSLGAANAANKGMLKGKIDGSSVVRSLSMSNGALWVDIAAYDENGNQIIDSVITKSTPVYNVKHSDWGAKGDGTTDDTAAVQLAIDAISTAGSGVLYFPLGNYVINGTLDINNCSIKIFGDGEGQTIVLQKTSPAGPMFDYDTADIKDVFIAENFSVQTEIGSVTSGDGALNLTWPSESTNNYEPNCILHNISVGPTDASKATSGFDYDIKLTNAKKPIISKGTIRGHSGGVAEGEAIQLLGYTDRVSIINTNIYDKDIAIVVDGNTDEVKVENLDTSGVRQGITTDVTDANIKVKDSIIVASEDGIKVLTNWAGIFEVSDCRISKTATSTEDWTGITSKATIYNLSGNTIQDDGSSSGTDIGIEVTDGIDGIIGGNIIIDVRTAGVRLAAGLSDFIVSKNRINSALTGIEVLAGASNDYTITNNNLEGCTTGITDGGTGTSKIIANNLNGGVSGTETQQVETATLTTTDATVTTLWSKTLEANTAYMITADVVAINSAGVAAIGSIFNVSVDDSGVQDSTLTYYYEITAGLDVTADLSGGDVRIRVTGISDTYKWKASVRVLEVAV